MNVLDAVVLRVWIDRIFPELSREEELSGAEAVQRLSDMRLMAQTSIDEAEIDDEVLSRWHEDAIELVAESVSQGV